MCCIVGCGDGKTNERMLLIEMFDKGGGEQFLNNFLLVLRYWHAIQVKGDGVTD